MKKLMRQDETFYVLEGNVQLCMYLLYSYNTEKAYIPQRSLTKLEAKFNEARYHNITISC